MVEIPDAFAATALARDGASARDWLDRLPALVDALLSRWDCRPDGPALHGGVGLVVPVHRDSDGPGVIKVSPPHPGNVHEPDAYDLWRGRGAVRLRERDDDAVAMLLERAGPGTLADTLAEGAGGVRTIAELVGRLGVPASERLPRLQARADAWLDELRRDARELPDVLSSRTVDAAAAVIVEVCSVQPDLVVHGDLHAGNVLRSGREPWLVIDPKGLCGDPAYDVGPMIKSYAWYRRDGSRLSSLVRYALDEFAEIANLDRERVRGWAVLHAVWGVYWECRHGHRVTPAGENTSRVLDLMISLVEAVGSEM